MIAIRLGQGNSPMKQSIILGLIAFFATALTIAGTVPVSLA